MTQFILLNTPSSHNIYMLHNIIKDDLALCYKPVICDYVWNCRGLGDDDDMPQIRKVF